MVLGIIKHKTSCLFEVLQRQDYSKNNGPLSLGLTSRPSEWKLFFHI